LRAGRLPDHERPECVTPRRSGSTAQQGDRAHEAEDDEHGNGGQEEPGQLAEQQPAAECDVAGADEQEHEEQQPDHVAVPLQRPG
jgi:hypothetical protein